MTREEFKVQLFRLEAIKIPGQIQVVCTLAATLEDPKEAFTLLHSILDQCAEEAAKYEAQIIKEMSDGWIETSGFGDEDGDKDGN